MEKLTDNKQTEEEQPFTKDLLNKNVDSELEGVKIGEILLQSSKLRCDQLCQLAVNLLSSPSIKKYLVKIDIKKFKGTYVG